MKRKTTRARASVPIVVQRQNKRARQPRPPRVPLRRQVRTFFATVLRRWRNGIKMASSALLGVVVFASFVAGARLVQQHIRTSEAFKTRTVHVEGNERLQPAEILRAAGLRVGAHVFDVAPEDAEARLEGHPWIASAEVQRSLPDTYSVRIEERHPAALLALGALYIVSDDGSVIKRVEAGDPVDLPVITGIDRKRFVSDRAHRTSMLLGIVALLHDYRGAGLLRNEPISEIHVEPDDGISLYVGQDAVHVRLGERPFRSKLQKLRRVLGRLGRDDQRPAYVYLDNVRRPDRVTVKLR